MQQTTLRTAVEGRAGARLERRVSPADRSPVKLFRGRQAILEMQARVSRLAHVSVQTGEADNLAYFLSTPDSVKKIPWLLTIGDPGHPAELSGAVLLFEYRIGIWGSRVFAGSDTSGRRDVIAAPEMRARVASTAARTLLQRGAQIVHLTFSDEYRADDGGGKDKDVAEDEVARELRKAPQPLRWSLAQREIPAYLPLLPSLDGTLARIGQRTRSNLRYTGAAPKPNWALAL